MTDDRYSDDDCQIFALLGREVLDWDKTPPDVSQFALFYRPDGDGYVEQCPWAQLGVTPPPLGKPDMDRMRYFTRPAYSDDKTVAGVAFITKLVARDQGGRPLPPFIDQINLTVRKDNGRWTLIERKQGPMT